MLLTAAAIVAGALILAALIVRGEVRPPPDRREIRELRQRLGAHEERDTALHDEIASRIAKLESDAADRVRAG